VKSEEDISSLFGQELLTYMKQLHRQNLVKIAAAEERLAASQVQHREMKKKHKAFMKRTEDLEAKREKRHLILSRLFDRFF